MKIVGCVVIMQTSGIIKFDKARVGEIGNECHLNFMNFI